MEKPRRKHLPPFFDNTDHAEFHHFPHGIAVDGTPLPPDLAPFDRQVLQVCGTLGSRPDPDDFRALFKVYPKILHQIQTAVGGEIFPGRDTESEFLEDLTAIWFERHGFEHVFCGSIDRGQLKGLHYVGRYLQLQQQGLAGKLPNNQHQQEVIEGVVYTIGVLLKYGSRIIVDKRTGYALISDAVELLIAATQAFKLRARPNSVCTFPVVDVDSGHTYPAVFVKENNAIVTFYPDVTPAAQHCSIDKSSTS
jgi:Bacterial EndoU nuclease